MLHVLIKKDNTKLLETGLRVVATVCDMGATNVGALNHLMAALGGSAEKHCFQVEGHL